LYHTKQTTRIKLDLFLTKSQK